MHIGARVAISDDQTPLGFAFYDVEDREGNSRMMPAPPSVNLDVTPFVDLDDQRRIEVEAFGVSFGLEGRGELEETIRESVFEDDIREVAETDEELADWPFELDEIVTELERHGVSSDAGELQALPFVVELDPVVEARLTG
jgi:hypothetical protein